MSDFLVFYAHLRSKLKLGPEFIWGYEMRLELFLEWQLVANKVKMAF